MNSDVRKYYKLITALPFVAEDDVLDAWLQLRSQLPSDLAAFASYVEYTWIGSRSSSLLFPIPSWNQHDASLVKLPRSTNMAEGWHHGFNSMLSCSHPSIWRLLEALKMEQNLIRMKLVRMYQLEEPREELPNGSVTMTGYNAFVILQQTHKCPRISAEMCKCLLILCNC